MKYIESYLTARIFPYVMRGNWISQFWGVLGRSIAALGSFCDSGALVPTPAHGDSGVGMREKKEA